MESLSSDLFMKTPRFHRAMSRPFFNKDRIGHFEVFDKHAGEARRFGCGSNVEFAPSRHGYYQNDFSFE